MPGFAISGGELGQTPSHKVEFHRAHRWLIDNIGVPMSTGQNNNPGGGATTTRGSFNAKAVAGQRTFKLFAKSLKLPSLSFEEVKLKAGSLTYKFPKRALWENVTVEFYDVYGLHKVLKDWQDKIWDPIKGMQVAELFMGEPKFILVDGQGVEQQKFTLKNAYPMKIDHSQLSYSSSDVKLLIVTYSYSHAEITIKDVATKGVVRSAPRGGSSPANQGINDGTNPEPV